MSDANAIWVLRNRYLNNTDSLAYKQDGFHNFSLLLKQEMHNIILWGNHKWKKNHFLKTKMDIYGLLDQTKQG